MHIKMFDVNLSPLPSIAPVQTLDRHVNRDLKITDHLSLWKTMLGEGRNVDLDQVSNHRVSNK